MTGSVDFVRMLDKGHKPSEKEIEKTIGGKVVKAWNDIRSFLNKYYDFTPELCFYGNKYGWTIRYRKSGKTLCSLFPESGAFTVLIVLGNKEMEKVFSIIDELGPEVASVIKGASQYHDGRWLWLRVRSKNQLRDIKELIELKKAPKEKSTKMQTLL
jgi:hypothetical protein